MICPKNYSKNYTKDSKYQNDYTKDYTNDYTKDYTNDYTNDYTKDYTNDYTKDYKYTILSIGVLKLLTIDIELVINKEHIFNKWNPEFIIACKKCIKIINKFNNKIINCKFDTISDISFIKNEMLDIIEIISYIVDVVGNIEHLKRFKLKHINLIKNIIKRCNNQRRKLTHIIKNRNKNKNNNDSDTILSYDSFDSHSFDSHSVDSHSVDSHPMVCQPTVFQPIELPHFNLMLVFNPLYYDTVMNMISQGICINFIL